MIKDIYGLSRAADNLARAYLVYNKVLQAGQAECPHDVKSEYQLYDDSWNRICERCGLVERTQPHRKNFEVLTGRAYEATSKEFEKYQTQVNWFLLSIDRELREGNPKEGQADPG